MIHRFNQGKEYWVLPGGGIEDNETAEEAIKREIREETNLTMTSCRPAFKVTAFDDIEKKHPVFICETQGEFIKFSGPELDETTSDDNQYTPEWIKVAEVEKLTLYPDGLRNRLSNL